MSIIKKKSYEICVIIIVNILFKILVKVHEYTLANLYHKEIP